MFFMPALRAFAVKLQKTGFSELRKKNSVFFYEDLATKSQYLCSLRAPCFLYIYIYIYIYIFIYISSTTGAYRNQHSVK
jgi:hypothetical protein